MLRDVPPVTLNFFGTTVHETGAVRDLGVTIDRHLNFRAHIDTLTHKCTGLLIALSHARHVIPQATLKEIVQALVLSLVRYGMSVYGSCGDTQVHRVQKIVNFCARVVTGRRRYDHISDAVQQLGWLTASQLIDYQTACAVHRVIATGQPESLHHTIGQRACERHQHSTRRSDRRTLPQIRTEAGRRRLCFRGVDLINRLEIEPCASSFRRDVKRAMLSQV